MKRLVQAEDRTQGTLLPEYLDDYVGADNPVHDVDVFMECLDLRKLGFASVDPLATGRPAYHPAVLLKLYIYGHLVFTESGSGARIDQMRQMPFTALPERLAANRRIAV